jgi:nucleolar protein 56
MDAYLVETPLAIFAVSKSGKLIGRTEIVEDAREASNVIRELELGKIPQSLLDLCKTLRKKRYETLIVERPSIVEKLHAASGLQVRLEPSSEIATKFRAKLENEWKGREEWLTEQGLQLKIVRNAEDYQHFLREVTVILAKEAVAVAVARRDLYAIQAVRAIDDLDKTFNLFAGRIREWYGLHFPELDKAIEKHDTYARLISELGSRENFTLENLVKMGISEEKAKAIAQAAVNSMGTSIGSEDLEQLRELCRASLGLIKLRSAVERYVEKVMNEVAPNMTAIIGATLSAKLISIAGGLQNLARMPASTLQVLGAEKALFRSLRTGARPPKHGIIFQFAPIHTAPRWQRGKMARAVSGKLAIAARVDSFRGEFVGEALRKNLEKRIEEIRAKYQSPHMRERNGRPSR